MQDGVEKIMQFTYTAPMTSKLLIEAAFSQFFSNWNPTAPSGALDEEPFIPVQEQSLAGGVPVPNMVYHGYAGLSNNHQTHNVWRAAMSYVTGAHSMKVGYAAAYEVTDIFGDFPTHGLQYRFLGGVPNQITQRPHVAAVNARATTPLRAGSGGAGKRCMGSLRYDTPELFNEGMNGLDRHRFGGQADAAIANGVNSSNDIVRAWAAYALFGNGSTASSELSKYCSMPPTRGFHRDQPASTFAQTRHRRGRPDDLPGGSAQRQLRS